MSYCHEYQTDRNNLKSIKKRSIQKNFANDIQETKRLKRQDASISGGFGNSGPNSGGFNGQNNLGGYNANNGGPFGPRTYSGRGYYGAGPYGGGQYGAGGHGNLGGNGQFSGPGRQNGYGGGPYGQRVGPYSNYRGQPRGRRRRRQRVTKTPGRRLANGILSFFIG
uniref:Uncharacterized protein n=1 Tax=Strongyloides venezuelensis TaxID=75913 RepID=A0A0K0FB34_STRVS